jgi:hypothetical protein
MSPLLLIERLDICGLKRIAGLAFGLDCGRGGLRGWYPELPG